MKQVLYLLMFLFMAGDASMAQDFQLKRYTTRDGLSSDAVSTLIKDRQGFFWLATGNGLNRFDGNHFDQFLNNPSDSTTIASNEINNLFIDRQQRLWVTTLAGLSLYHPYAQTFSNYAPDTNVLPKIGNLYPAITEDDSGHIWLGGWYDLLIFDLKTKSFRSSGWAEYARKIKPVNGNHSRVVVLGLKPKSKQAFWVLTTYGLFSVHTVTKQFQYYPNPLIQDYYGCQLNSIDQQGRVWMGTYQNGVLCYDPQNDRWEQLATPAVYQLQKGFDWAYGIAPLNSDTMLYCSRKEWICLVKNGDNYEPRKAPAFQQAGGGYIQWLKDGDIYWLVSGNGLTKLYPGKRQFNAVTTPFLQHTSRIFPLKGTAEMIAGDVQAKRVLRFDAATGQHRLITQMDGQPLNGIFISYAALNDASGLLCTEEGAYLYQPVANRCTALQLPPKVHASNPSMLRNIVQGFNGICWIRDRRQGIIEFDARKKQCRYLTICNSNEQTTFCSLFFDSAANRLWVGVENEGVYIYDVAGGTSSHHLFNIAPSQKGATFNGFASGSKGIVYGAEISYGLFEIFTATKHYNRYTHQDGMASNSCNFCCRDAAGNIWISHVEGISRFDTSNKSFMNFPQLKAAANYAGFLQADASGNMWMPSDSGYLQWRIHDFENVYPVGSIYLRRATQGTTPLGIDSVYHFSHQQNNISFLFGFHAYDLPEPVSFQYQLNQSAWVDFNAEQGIVFSNLSPNAYLLKVRVKNWTVAPVLIQFIVAPPFYRTWWFLLMVAIAAAGLVIWLFRRRIGFIRQEAALKQQIAETETMALRAQMNPHFIFNCISSIDNFILDNDRENASSYLNKFAKLIRSILDNSRLALVPLWKDWETLQLYLELEHLRSNGQFTYRMEADEQLLNGHYKIPPLIIQPYIENAIHHGLNPLTGRAGELVISAKLSNHLLEYVVYDNGVGRSHGRLQQVAIHQSYGMQMTSDRVKLFNNQAAPDIDILDLFAADGLPAGTKITVRLTI